MQTVTVTATPVQSAEDPTTISHSDWYVVTVWERQAGDEGIRFEQRVTMTDPKGEMRLQALTEFEMTKRYHRNLGKVPGFPVSLHDGEYLLSVAVRDMQKDDWEEKGTYPLRVASRIAPESKPPAQTSKTQTH